MATFFSARLLVDLFFRDDLLNSLPDAHSRRRCFLLPRFHFANQQRDLSLDVAAGLQRFENLLGVATQEFLMDLGHFAGNDYVPFASQNLDDVLQRSNHPMGRFVKHLRPRRFADALQNLTPLANFGGQESAETK